ncbi:hypothetical protein FHR83_002054 [Actinoplanes campanulatus]|uniref:Uncharacterized protein n=1 Tax=Actinoplanes campanulatus TaxID=113559 RepID=A0A7W5AE66_9ACTN|nr:hypothetical protein [Actinoplanes campanulatus]
MSRSWATTPAKVGQLVAVPSFGGHVVEERHRAACTVGARQGRGGHLDHPAVGCHLSWSRSAFRFQLFLLYACPRPRLSGPFRSLGAISLPAPACAAPAGRRSVPGQAEPDRHVLTCRRSRPPAFRSRWPGGRGVADQAPGLPARGRCACRPVRVVALTPGWARTAAESWSPTWHMAATAAHVAASVCAHLRKLALTGTSRECGTPVHRLV